MIQSTDQQLLSLGNEQMFDSDGTYYIGCRVLHTTIIRYLWVLRRLLGEEVYRRYRRNQVLRDRRMFHVTLVTPPEYEAMASEYAVLETGLVFDLELKGLGHVSDGEDNCYYIIADSQGMQEYRQKLGLPHHDFHVTLGFEAQDIHHMPKDMSTLIDPVIQSTGHASRQ